MVKRFYVFRIKHLASQLSIVVAFEGREKDSWGYWGSNDTSKLFYSLNNERSKLQKDCLAIEDNLVAYTKEILFESSADISEELKEELIRGFTPNDARYRESRAYAKYL